MVRRLFFVVASLLLALVIVVAVAAGLAVQRSPAVPVDAPSVAATGHSIATRRAQDPRRLPPGSPAALALGTADLEQLLNLASTRFAPMAWRVKIDAGRARVMVSVDLAEWAGPLWLNIDATLVQADALPQLKDWRVGALPLPSWVGRWLLRRLVAQLDHGFEAGLADRVVRRVEFLPGTLRVAYVWRGDLGLRVGAALPPPGDLARMQSYAEYLAAIGPALSGGDAVPLERLLQPLFEHARQRSLADEDPRRENRAAILALAVMTEGRRYSSLSPEASGWPDPPRRAVTLAGRTDLPRHFLIAALLTFDGGERLADTMSLAKEVDDARFGSGFSFNDLAAGRAGARFAVLATESPLRLQAVVARGVGESDLLPEVRDLPEFLSLPEFRRRFGEVGSPAYRAMMALIESRVGALTLAAKVAAAPADGAIR